MNKEAKRYLHKQFHLLLIALLLYELIFQSIAASLVLYGSDVLQNGAMAVSISAPFALLSAFMILGYSSGKPIHQKMKLRSFIFLLFFIFGVQLISGTIMEPLEAFLNSLGFPLSYTREAAGGGAITDWPTVLYTVCLAPLYEEFFFRGIIFGYLRRFGKVFAIFLSTFLFGLLHINILQFLPAFLLGMLLAYIREVYGLRWSFALHAGNNLLVLIFNNLGESFIAVSLLYAIFLYGGLLCVIVFFIRNYRRVLNYIREEPSFPEVSRVFFLSIWTVLFLLFIFLMILLNLQ